MLDLDHTVGSLAAVKDSRLIGHLKFVGREGRRPAILTISQKSTTVPTQECRFFCCWMAIQVGKFPSVSFASESAKHNGDKHCVSSNEYLPYRPLSLAFVCRPTNPQCVVCIKPTTNTYTITICLYTYRSKCLMMPVVKWDEAGLFNSHYQDWR